MQSDSKSVKEEECELIYCGCTAGGPHWNWGEKRCTEEGLRRYARLRSCFVTDVWDGITLRGSNHLAPARPADSKSKLFTSLLEDKIVQREDIVSWSLHLSNSRDLAIWEKIEACKFSTITIWLTSKKQLNNPNQDLIASPTPNGWAKADNFEADTILCNSKK